MLMPVKQAQQPCTVRVTSVMFWPASVCPCELQAIMGSTFSVNVTGGVPDPAASSAAALACPDAVDLGLEVLTACIAVQLQARPALLHYYPYSSVDQPTYGLSLH